MNRNTDHISYDIKMEMLALLPNVPVPLKAICNDLGLTRLKAMEILGEIKYNINYYDSNMGTAIACHVDDFDAMREEAGAYMSEVYDD